MHFPLYHVELVQRTLWKLELNLLILTLTLVVKRNPQVVLFPAWASIDVTGRKLHIEQSNQIYRRKTLLWCVLLTFRLHQFSHMLEEQKSFPWHWSLSSNCLLSRFFQSAGFKEEGCLFRVSRSLRLLHLSTHFSKHSISISLIDKASRPFSDLWTTFNSLDPWPLWYHTVLIFL